MFDTVLSSVLTSASAHIQPCEESAVIFPAAVAWIGTAPSLIQDKGVFGSSTTALGAVDHGDTVVPVYPVAYAPSSSLNESTIGCPGKV